MPRPGVPYDDVAQAIHALNKAGLNPSIRLIREKLGKGSLTTIAEHKRTFEAEQSDGPTQALPDPVARHLIKGAESFWQELVDAAEAEIQRVRQDAAETTAALETRLKQADDDVVSLRESLGVQALEMADLEKVMKGDAEKLADRDAALQLKAVEINRVEAKLEVLQAQNVELKAEADASAQALSEVETDRARLTERIERDAVEHAKDKTALQKHFNEYKDRLVTMSDDVREANVGRRQAESTATAAEKRAENEQQNSKRLQAEITDLKDEVRLLTEKLGEARGQLIGSERELVNQRQRFEERLKDKVDKAATAGRPKTGPKFSAPVRAGRGRASPVADR